MFQFTLYSIMLLLTGTTNHKSFMTFLKKSTIIDPTKLTFTFDT